MPKSPVTKKPKEKPRYLADVPKPDDEAVMALFYGGKKEAGGTAAPAPDDNLGRTVLLAVDAIDPDLGQPRKIFDLGKLEELAESIKAEGLVQPIAVRPTGQRYVLVAGERRWRAHKMLGRTEIEAKVFDVTPAQAFRLSLIENVQRDSLLPLEEARAYQRMLDEHSITQSDLGRQLGLDRRRVSEKLTLLRLPETVLELLSARSDTFGERHAMLLAAASGVDVVALARRCAEEGWSLVRLRAALDKRDLEPLEPRLFQNLHVAMNRRGGFTLTVRARSRDEVPTTIAELERTVDSLRESFELSARADNGKQGEDATTEN